MPGYLVTVRVAHPRPALLQGQVPEDPVTFLSRSWRSAECWGGGQGPPILATQGEHLSWNPLFQEGTTHAELSSLPFQLPCVDTAFSALNVYLR